MVKAKAARWSVAVVENSFAVTNGRFWANILRTQSCYSAPADVFPIGNLFAYTFYLRRRMHGANKGSVD